MIGGCGFRSSLIRSWRSSLPYLLYQRNAPTQYTLPSSAKRNKSTNKYTSGNNKTRIQDIYDQAKDNAASFDAHFQYQHKPLSISPARWTCLPPVRPPTPIPGRKKIPKDPVTLQYLVPLPPYALSGRVDLPISSPTMLDLQPPADHPSAIHNNPSREIRNPMVRNTYTVDALRQAGALARKMLEYACSLAVPGASTEQINDLVHEAILASGAYPSPLNYAGFPKSVCISINEVICHGIPHPSHILHPGDLVKFDVSCFYQGVHGDNCATVVVGDVVDTWTKTDTHITTNTTTTTTFTNTHELFPHLLYADWRHVPYKQTFNSKPEELLFITNRRLSIATQEALYAAISTCHPGSCLTDVGNAISAVADAYGYDSVRKYRGHGIAREFHVAPFVKHYRNQDFLELLPGMVFTIEPMITEGHWECDEWDSDQWTVVTLDGGRAAQFEHMVHITDDGVEILTTYPH